MTAACAGAASAISGRYLAILKGLVDCSTDKSRSIGATRPGGTIIVSCDKEGDEDGQHKPQLKHTKSRIHYFRYPFCILRSGWVAAGPPGYTGKAAPSTGSGWGLRHRSDQRAGGLRAQ